MILLPFREWRTQKSVCDFVCLIRVFLAIFFPARQVFDCLFCCLFCLYLLVLFFFVCLFVCFVVSAEKRDGYLKFRFE